MPYTAQIQKAKALVEVKEKLLKEHIGELTALLSADVVNQSQIRVRYKDLNAFFSKYEEAREALFSISSEPMIADEWTEIRALYYDSAGKVGNLISPRSDDTGFNPIGNSTLVEKLKQSKLPTASIPKFDGNHHEWLTFKDWFMNVVHIRNDIEDVTKFIYLRNALSGEALRKVEIFSLSSNNYAKAWESLIQAYERKRILISKHLNAIFDLEPLKSISSRELSSLIDDLKQHLTMLNTLGIKPDDHTIVCMMERKLPLPIREKWEECLQLDEIPTLKRLYDFIDRSVFRLCTSEQALGRDEKSQEGKRPSDTTYPIKAKKANSGNARAFVTSTETQAPFSPCFYCGDNHALFRCIKFKALSVDERKSFVASKSLCFNCLRLH